MKYWTLLLPIVSLLTIPKLQGQETVNQVVKDKIKAVLEEAQIVATDKEISDLEKSSSKKSKKNGRKLKDFKKKLIDNYPSPSGAGIGEKLIDDKYTMHLSSLDNLSSHIFEENFSIPDNTYGDLSVLENGKSMAIDDLRSYYKLHSNLTYILAQSVKADAQIGKSDFFNATASKALRNDYSRDNSFSIAAGTFNSVKGKLFSGAINNQIALEDFKPLIELWYLYSNNKITETNKVIRSFTGLVISTHADFKMSSERVYSGESRIKYSIPFLRTEAEAKGNWTKKNEVSSNSTTHSIYMIKAPVMQEIPKPSKIKELWDEIRPPRPIYENIDNFVHLEPEGKASTFFLKFGPVPGFERDVKAEYKYTLNNLPLDKKILSDVRIKYDRPDLDNGLNVYKVKLFRNDKFFRSYNGKENIIINDDVKIKLCLTPKVGDLQLCKEYSVRVKAETYPVPKVRSDDIKSVLNENIYSWEVPFYINTKQGTNVISGMEIESVFIENSDFQYLKDDIMNSARIVGSNVEGYKINFKMQVSPSSVHSNERLPINFILKFDQDNIQQERTMYLNLILESNIDRIPEFMTFADVKEMISLISEDIPLSNSMSFLEVKENIFSIELVELVEQDQKLSNGISIESFLVYLNKNNLSEIQPADTLENGYSFAQFKEDLESYNQTLAIDIRYESLLRLLKREFAVSYILNEGYKIRSFFLDKERLKTYLD